MEFEREPSFEFFNEPPPFKWWVAFQILEIFGLISRRDQSPSPNSPTPFYVGQSYYYGGSEYSSGSPRTPLSARFITIQPRSDNGDGRDARMLYVSGPERKLINSTPITKKRKGNNKYGQSGSHRCLRCQKGKRKVWSRMRIATNFTVCLQFEKWALSKMCRTRVLRLWRKVADAEEISGHASTAREWISIPRLGWYSLTVLLDRRLSYAHPVFRSPPTAALETRELGTSQGRGIV